jgi:hypothetical protein
MSESSLIVALYRLVELESGCIRIDGVDVGQIGLDALRTKINLIPQEPVLFSGDVRYNLDPFSRATDEQLWRALEQVNLASKIRSMDGGLAFKMSEGESLSVGERQLLCVARALLRDTRVLVLDEGLSTEHDSISCSFLLCSTLALASCAVAYFSFLRLLSAFFSHRFCGYRERQLDPICDRKPFSICDRARHRASPVDHHGLSQDFGTQFHHAAVACVELNRSGRHVSMLRSLILHCL